MADDVIIKIGASTAGFQKALDEVSRKTEDLENKLSTIAKVSGAAFAAFTAEIFLSVKAYGEADAAARKLNQALQNQGIFTEKLVDEYKSFAEAVQAKTGIDDDALVASQATLQGLIGQKKITQEMTFAIANLSAAKGVDLEASAALIGKGINGQTAALQKLGIQIDGNLTKEERTEQILRKVEQAYGGQAEAANKGIGSLKGLETAFGNLQEAIGARFEPAITASIKGLTKFITQVKENKPLVDLIVSLTLAGTIVSGLGLALGVAGIAFLQLRAAMLAANIAMSATSLIVKGLIGATGIGLLVIIIAEIYLNWSSIWPRMQKVFAAFVGSITELVGGLGSIFSALFTLDLNQLKAGLAQVKAALAKGFAEATAEIKPITIGETQDAGKAAEADKAARILAAQESRKLAIVKAGNELLTLEANQASKEQIDLKKQEVELLKQIEDDKNVSIRGKLVEHLATIRGLQDQQIQIDSERRSILNNDLLTKNAEFEALSDEQKAAFREKNQQQLLTDIQTEATTREIAALDTSKRQIAANNLYLKNQLEFGKSFAEINKFIHSDEIKGTREATDELAQLQNSSNSELKAIGKAAAIAQIGIKTAESAMNIFAGFSKIPIIGPILGAAGAAAAIAYGAEQISKVKGYAAGGIVTGGIPGVDSVPIMAQQNEIVAPAQNFNEVIGSVRAQREATKMRDEGKTPGSAAAGGSATVELFFRGDLAQYIEAKIVENEKLGLSIRGTS